MDRYAAVGGRFLVIAKLEEPARWVATALLLRVGASDYVVYRPVAALDVDGDGVPELVVHWNGGDSWADVLYRLDDNGWNWELVAESVGGSTA